MSSRSISSENIHPQTDKTNISTLYGEQLSERLINVEKAGEYLVEKFRTTTYIKRMILEFEHKLLCIPEEKRKSNLIKYMFNTPFQRFIFNKLCEYYGIICFMYPNPKKLLLFCSRHTFPKKSISKLAQEAEKKPIISISEIGVQNMELPPNDGSRGDDLKSCNLKKTSDVNDSLCALLAKRVWALKPGIDAPKVKYSLSYKDELNSDFEELIADDIGKNIHYVEIFSSPVI
ncbi:hypothetical protein RF11_15809 [Thelohanellus kitauei]|uniref:Uncharacterized protein n=1 Tax=Thelohanellus kitauei TaxID=669202 RepID=A0A0C2IKP5_THEKT|nr:hypothetical protein RF11_15809 [Thelohanellus kitauei]